MSLPQPPELLADPFGLWETPPGVALSFGAAAGGAPEAGGTPEAGGALEAPGAVWSVDASQAGALERRGEQVRAVEAGLETAEARWDDFLRGWGSARPGVSFSVSETMDEPERHLAMALAQLGGGASYGLPGGLDLDSLRKQFEDWLERANRQLLHFVWVDTLLAGRLAARTAVAWNGSVSTTCAGALEPSLLHTHGQSFGLAMTSRVTTLRAVVTVVRMAGKLALAVATPLGPLQTLLLASQFLREVILPAAQAMMAEKTA